MLIPRRMVPGLTWSLSGILVVVVRIIIFRSTTWIPWLIIGAGMIVYGSARVVTAYLKTRPQTAETPKE